MSIKEFKILLHLKGNPGVSQRKLAELFNISLGSINMILQNFIGQELIEYRKSEYILTKVGALNLKSQLVSTAVILSAGMGSRLKSIIGGDIPKPLFIFEGKPLLERSIEKLMKCGIEKIIIVGGYKYEKLDYLVEKYAPYVMITLNPIYENSGTVESLMSVSEVVNDDFILLEGDLLYESLAIDYLQTNFKKDTILLSKDKESRDAVYVEKRENYVYRMSKDRKTLGKIDGEMVGISKISQDLFLQIMIYYSRANNPMLHYEYAIEEISKTYPVYCKKIDNLVWCEIDDSQQLEFAKKDIKKKLIEKGEL